MNPGFASGSELLSTLPPERSPVIEGLFDRGAVVEIIGPSKTRKSFLALQIALGLAAGRDVCGLAIPTAMPIAFLNLELTRDDFHRRLWNMGSELNISHKDVGDRFKIYNLRGTKPEDVLSMIEDCEGVSGLVVDPIYSLLDGDESRPETWKPIIAKFNRCAEKHGFVLYVHHDTKGDAGERNVRDRGAGSNISGRNAYARVTMTPHKTDPDDSVVLNFMLRGYPQRKPATLTFQENVFYVSDLPPIAETGTSRRSHQNRVEVTDEQCLESVSRKPIQAAQFMELLKKFGLSEHKARTKRAELLNEGVIAMCKVGFPAKTFYGTPEGIKQLEDSFNENRQS